MLLKVYSCNCSRAYHVDITSYSMVIYQQNNGDHMQTDHKITISMDNAQQYIYIRIATFIIILYVT